MRKVVQFVLKLVAVCMVVAAAACCVIAYWDKISAFLGCARDKIAEKRACCCHSEYDDYADWDEE
ncbi:hypothetical protein [Pseudoflavonifractor intestinihominis]|uniref:Lipoprotein n=1 Tax=Pseudoflavonifractor intestinihominis TaxID=3133171 RepID=A0ABV1E7P8_9FIRM|nr:hypothetical protein [uncultured Pseudoflavonifractor sp.]